ncbi:putative membrane protein [Streptomyces davaonensis JCM 4913]|uniref:Putative membrane protein n=1 Tax=Streptomyces davaonensis (strain DSM 101723 / JCM 4913 / KCC S-0913 / 768) TaxID=1214101 RepID=K4QVF6_STRDJ|nr:MFS transporter [Streptomyces davaonensis]CCK25023.1 putative membrane protein [Streptomyces davaonensis JCM 4913]
MADISGPPPSVINGPGIAGAPDPQHVQAVVAKRLDGLPVTRWHRRVLAVVGLGSFFNFFEVALSSLLVPLLPAAWVVTTTDKSLLISATFAGELLGAVALSGLADRIGRRRMFQINLVAYAVLSVAAACAQGPTQLIVLRFLLGIGLGAELALVDTYLTELMPAARRGRMLATAYALGMLAVPVAGVLAARLPHSLASVSSWRWLMVLAGAGALCVYLLRRNLPESPRWLAAHRPTEALAAVERIEETAGLPVTAVFPAAPALGLGNQEGGERPKLWGSALRKRTFLVCLMETLGPVGFYGFASIAPLVLLHKGFTVVDSLTYLAMTAIGYPLGCYVLMHLAERIQRRTLVIASSLLVAVAGTVFGLGDSVWVIIPAGLLTTLMSVINATVSRAYGAELFPTAVRNTALGRTYSLSRLVAAILPFCTLPVLEHLGAGAVYVGCASLIALMSLAVAALGPRTNAVALEGI